MRRTFKIVFLRQNVTVNVTITNQLAQVGETQIPMKWRRRRDSNPRYLFRYN